MNSAATSRMIEVYKEMAQKLPQTTQDRFVSLIKRGETIGEAREACRITLDEAMGLMNIYLLEKPERD